MSRVFFRADANAEIGGGHMMRCLTIAAAMRQDCEPPVANAEGIEPPVDNAEGIEPPASAADDSSSLYCAEHSAEPVVSAPWRTSRSEENMRPPGAADVIFLCADEDSARLPKEAGYETRVLGTDYRKMEAELEVLASMFRAPGAAREDIVIVDSYYATDAYLAALREYARVVLIEDELKKPRPVDVLINYNFSAERADYARVWTGAVINPSSPGEAGGDAPLLLLGPAYAPVRAQFQNRQVEIRDEVRNILILCGASDPLNAAAQIYRTLSDTVSLSQFHIVSGAYNPHIEELRALSKEHENLVIHEQVADMATLMCGMDLCVTAGGSTMYELCAVGLPFVCFSVADNQRPLCEAVSAKKIAPYAGAMDLDAEGTLPQIVSYVRELSADRLLRATRQESQRALIDGQGASNIASALLS